jgi:hypothetical protein
MNFIVTSTGFLGTVYAGFNNAPYLPSVTFTMLYPYKKTNKNTEINT